MNKHNHFPANIAMLNFGTTMIQGISDKFECYLVSDSEEGSGIEDTALGSESEDHWEELSDMNMEEEVEAEEEEGEPDDVDMSS
jgi:hypothetical protein